MAATHRLAIKNNNTASNDPCAICGTRTDPQTGPELFLEDSRALVCYLCGDRYDPELTRCLLEYRNARNLQGWLDEPPGTVHIVDEGEDVPDNVRH
jgi:hypothetical protein